MIVSALFIFSYLLQGIVFLCPYDKAKVVPEQGSRAQPYEFVM
jgi:hypothetical protein